MPDNKYSDFSANYVISEDVIATIAVNAAKDVEGVSGFGNRPADLYSTFRIGADDLKHCKVTITNYDIKIHMYLTLTGNSKIKEVSANVQNAVKAAIQNMTGRVVTRVDVTITGVANQPTEDDED